MKGLRIATVYRDDRYERFPTYNMAFIRWLRLSGAFAALGARVDMIVDVDAPPADLAPGVRMVPFAAVRWGDYDIVKAHYQRGFETLERYGGGCHPFIVSALATVVGPTDGLPGVQVTPADRATLWPVQERIARQARVVSVRTPQNGRLWGELFPSRAAPVLVPTGVDTHLPPPGPDPYAGLGAVAVYVGNLRRQQPGHLNRMWGARLEDIGVRLRGRGVTLCYVGPRPDDPLDPAKVVDLGPVPNDRIWDYKRCARVGLALAEGSEQRNESSKVYYYLRAGLPVVGEAPIPNNDLLGLTGLGLTVPYGDDLALVDAVEDACHREWPREDAVDHVLAHHTWRHRAETYADAVQVRSTGGGSVFTELATLADARRIAEVHVRARRAAYRELVAASVLAAESVEGREARWRTRLVDPDGRCWLATDRAGLFGFAFTAPTRDEDLGGAAELFALYLLEERVGRGHGRRLLTHAVEDLRARGFGEVVLWVAAENRRAIRFYERAGFFFDDRVGSGPLGDTGLMRCRMRRTLAG